MPTIQEEREITDLGQLCEFELLENLPGNGTPLRRFRARVSYSRIRGINAGEGVTYDRNYFIGGLFGGSNIDHILIPSPFPEFSYWEMPGQYDGIVVANTEEELQKVGTKTTTFVSRRLRKDNVFSETTDVKVSEPTIQNFELPQPMAFLINGRFNYAVGRLNFEVEGYGKPLQNDNTHWSEHPFH